MIMDGFTTVGFIEGEAGCSWDHRDTLACIAAWERSWSLTHEQPKSYSAIGALGKGKPSGFSSCP